MADAKDERVWTQHAREHENLVEYSFDHDSTLKSYLGKVEGVKIVVDLGCGSALWRHLFDGYEYIGVDQNEAMVNRAKRRFPDDKFLVCNGKALEPLEDGSVDLVFTSAVLQHNLHPEKEQVVKEIVRVLRPGGYYLGTENTFREDNYATTFRHGNTQYRDDLTDGYSFTPKGWEDFMRPLGLKLLEFTKPSEYLYIKE